MEEVKSYVKPQLSTLADATPCWERGVSITRRDAIHALLRCAGIIKTSLTAAAFRLTTVPSELIILALEC